MERNRKKNYLIELDGAIRKYLRAIPLIGRSTEIRRNLSRFGSGLKVEYDPNKSRNYGISPSAK